MMFRSQKRILIHGGVSLRIISIYVVIEAKDRADLWREDRVGREEILWLDFDESQPFMPGKKRMK